MTYVRDHFLLDETAIPEHWYNILPDLEIEVPRERKARVDVDPDARPKLQPQVPLSMYRQSVGSQRFVPIPDQVLDQYRQWRPTPLVRARKLERYLDTTAHLYYKYEGTNPSGSHKLNTALAQAYFYKHAGIQELATGTGAGQWGTALAMACSSYGMRCTAFMVRCSYDQKPYRRVLMELYGARVVPSPSDETEPGREALARDPNTDGSIAIANAEAIEYARNAKGGRFSIGSGEHHVLLHQTIIGEEAVRQMELVGEFPDIVIGAMGAGSNFAGIAFPFYREKIRRGSETRLVAVEPEACPKMTEGTYAWDYNDFSGVTPMTKMYTLGHTFSAPGIHAGGLRYHGAAPLVSAMYHHGLLEATAYAQRAVFEAGVTFARVEGLVPAPESAHAVRCAIDEALKAKAERVPKVILFNLSGHGLLDLGAYQQYLAGELVDHSASSDAIATSIARLPAVDEGLAVSWT